MDGLVHMNFLHPLVFAGKKVVFAKIVAGVAVIMWFERVIVGHLCFVGLWD